MHFTQFKDEQLNGLAELGNVAQFVSFSPRQDQRFSRVLGQAPNKRYSTTDVALDTLLTRAPERCVNIRTFRPQQTQGNDFVYGVGSKDEASALVRKYTSEGLYVIVNETVDINDGGVSGVALGGLFEFAPGATPRVVESGAVASLEIEKAEAILRRVYKLTPDLPSGNLRVEFSLHPRKRGFRSTHTLLWEAEHSSVGTLTATPQWPNLFSELVGDKAFGLLIADAYGYSVPKTTVLCRNLPPFVFGRSTGEDVVWMRTAPKRAEPGFFPTVRGWTDPFALMNTESAADRLASLLIQEEVKSLYSGAIITTTAGNPLIEGVQGFGDEFMLGMQGPADLPKTLILDLNGLHDSLRAFLGSVRIEWAYDGKRIWVLQLQQTQAQSLDRTIVAGQACNEIDFEVSRGLGALRDTIEHLPRNTGIRLVGSVGMTSHFADVLRRHNIPSRIN